jgi:predicted RND superfamily exporter protein
MRDVDRYFDKTFPDVTLKITGMMPLLFKTLSNVVVSMAMSYVIAIVIITLLMILLIGRFRIGLLSMIPNITPILIMLGLMGALSFPMDAFTMMVGSIAIGLAVDDTIHFMHNFRRYYEEKGDPVWAVQETLHTTGRAMLVTTVVLSIGFFIFMFADMKNIFNFGFLTGITIIMALLSDYFIAPALMVLANKAVSNKL